jgi:hypothetical protein
MGKGKSETKKTAKRNIRIQRADFKTICKNKKSKKRESKNPKPSRKQDTKPGKINDSDQIKITIEHFFKNKVNEIICQISDPRKIAMCTYTLNHLTWLGILMFIFRLGSRNRLLKERETNEFLDNLLALSGSEEESVAHPDSMNYLFKKLPISEFEYLKVELVKELIRKRVLDPARLFGSFRIAVDATDLFSFDSRHCENCLVTEHKSEAVTYSHKMLDAKLVSENGFAFSVCSESVENVDGKYVKQDCELKGFYRMEKELKELFPRTPLCLLLDGLYACDEVFNICRRNSWEFIIVLKPKKIPTLYKNAVNKSKNYPQNKIMLESENETEIISWIQSIQYNKHKLNVVFSQKTVIKNKKTKITNNTWVTNIRPKANNAAELIKRGGRQRWKIENQGFKEQKCDGYNLEHLYGKDPNAWKNYYQLLQIAHMISQLIIYSDICMKLQKQSVAKDSFCPIKPLRKYYNTIITFVDRLRCSFREHPFSPLVNKLKGKIQIRFSSG